MFSVLSVLGLASLGIAADALFDVFEHDEETAGDDDALPLETWEAAGGGLLDFAADDLPDVEADPAGAPPPVAEMPRGAVIEGFDPATDTIELEYHAALPPPQVTVAEAADGNGTDIAFDGVVVATVAGVTGISADDVVLVAA